MISEDNIAQPIQQLLAFYNEAGVAFPGVDAAALLAAIESVKASQDAVQKSEELLQDAKEDRARQNEALSKLAKKAHEYARIYAADDDALKRRVEAIELKAKVRKTRKAKKKKELTLAPVEEGTEQGDIAA